jgi:CRISPR-associated endonuclease/helicase Cas3
MNGPNLTDELAPALTPAYLDHLKAKSLSRSRTPGTQDTLALHTWQVLRRLADQFVLQPDLTDHIGDERLWHQLFWGCFLHDFGKAASGFQDRLSDDDDRKKSPDAIQWSAGRHRHEVLSLAFLDGIFPSGHPDRIAVSGIIASHHRDLYGKPGYAIMNKYRPTRQHDNGANARLDFLVSQFDPADVRLLWRWVREYGSRWRNSLGLESVVEPITIHEQPCRVEGIVSVLNDLNRFLKQDRDITPLENQTILNCVLGRGLILTADRTASASIGPLPKLDLTPQRAMQPLTGLTLRAHQAAANHTPARHVILIAPTSSGKTEAAMLWAARQNASRLFYVLPYQASMNAMQDRLANKYYGIENPSDNDVVAIQHSRAALKIYRDHMDADSGLAAKAAVNAAKAHNNRADLNAYPVKVFSPYQMLKAAYQLRAYESMIVDFAGAVFIFDEIHAYEPKRLALIVEMIRWLADNLNARFFIMTATLPPLVRDQLTAALHGIEIIRKPELYSDFQRHTLHLLNGTLTDYRDEIVQRWQQGESVLVCCNTVAHAQTIFDALSAAMKPRNDNDLMLLHGRFNMRDRRQRETQLMRRVGVGEQARTPTVFVATQVIEVSLNIDFDTLYTEPAPLDALLQRFGRVNRGRNQAKTLCPVHVTRHIIDQGKPYALDYIERSLAVLEPHDNQPIDEGQVEAMLAEMFTSAMRETWRTTYETNAQQFRHHILGTIQPYESDRIAEDEFYKLFDGTQILPETCLTDYDNLIEQGRYIEASELLVNISWGAFHTFRNNALLVLHNDKAKPPLYCANHQTMPYTSTSGLQYPERDTDQ